MLWFSGCHVAHLVLLFPWRQVGLTRPELVLREGQSPLFPSSCLRC